MSLKTDDEVIEHLNAVYDQMRPQHLGKWLKEQDLFWAEKPRAGTTKAFYDSLCKGGWQAFSLAGWKNGLNDDRGNLTLRFVDIAEASDSVRLSAGKPRSVIFWENVEGVLTDKTNAFGCLVSSLAGLPGVLAFPKWPNAGIVRGPKRNIAWRVLDPKYFGLPQQRRRLWISYRQMRQKAYTFRRQAVLGSFVAAKNGKRLSTHALGKCC